MINKIVLIVALSCSAMFLGCSSEKTPATTETEPVSANQKGETDPSADIPADSAADSPDASSTVEPDAASKNQDSEPAASKSGSPRFEDYRAAETYSGKRPPLKFTSETGQFRTRLNSAAKEQPNFAGKYVIATWGCGTDCLMGGIINLETGNTYAIPFSVCCVLENTDSDVDKIEFRKDSNLIIFNGLLNEEESETDKHFYVFEKEKLVRVSIK